MKVDSGGLADRLFAEAVASDLRDTDAFLEVRLKSTTDKLFQWVRERSTVHHADLHASAAEIEEALAFARRRFDELSPPGVNSISSRLLKLGCSLLEFDGHDLVLKVDDQEPGRELLRWRFISLLVPAGILAAAAAAQQGRPAAPSRIRLLHPSMAPDGPVAQQHLHQSASVTFERLWASVRTRALLEPGKLQRSLRSKRAFCPHMHKGPCVGAMDDNSDERRCSNVARAQHMDIWLGQISRSIVAGEILSRHARHSGLLEECGHCQIQWQTLNNLLPGRPGVAAVSAYPWTDQVRSLARDRRAERTARAKHGGRLVEHRDFIDDLVNAESAMLTTAFCRLRAEPEDVKYEALLIQYLRIKTATYRQIVHSPGRPGLEKFLHHFKQIEIYQPNKTSLGLQAAQSPELDLRSTEYRVSPEDWLEQEQAASRGRRRNRVPGPKRANKDATLIHFQRSKTQKTLPLHGRNIRRLEDLARRIGNVLQRDRQRLLELRGVDICGVEEHQPLWVSAQTLIHARALSSEIAGCAPVRGLPYRCDGDEKNPGLMRVEPLRVTMHTGEDFHWLTTGVRTVAEPFQWNVIRRGDRIGHGLAVTLDPAGWWFRREGDVIGVSDFDRLQDLAFLALFTKSHRSVAARVLQAREKMECVGAVGRTKAQERWLGDQIDAILTRLKTGHSRDEDPVLIAAKLWSTIGSPVMRQLHGSRSAPSDADEPHIRLLYRYLWRRGFRKEADQKRRISIVSKNSHELTLLIAARKIVIRRLARWQIPIESNPSSNLVVGSLDALASQDFLAQSSHHSREIGRETPAWTISTDDPVTFATSLADEYAYAWAGMVLRADNPYDPAHARALLEEAAATSMRTRFAARPA